MKGPALNALLSTFTVLVVCNKKESGLQSKDSRYRITVSYYDIVNWSPDGLLGGDCLAMTVSASANRPGYKLIQKQKYKSSQIVSLRARPVETPRDPVCLNQKEMARGE